MAKSKSKSQNSSLGETKQLNNRYSLLKKGQTAPKGSNEWAAYKLMRNKCTKLIRVAEASYWKSKFQGVSSSSKEFWKCVNEFTGVHKVSTIGPLEECINSTKGKCEHMNNYFASVGKLRKAKEKPRKPQKTQNYCNIFTELLLSSIPLTTIQTNY